MRKQRINSGYVHAVKVDEYSRATTKNGGKIEKGKTYVAHGFHDDREGTWVTVRTGKDTFVDVDIKCLEYVRQLKRKQ